MTSYHMHQCDRCHTTTQHPTSWKRVEVFPRAPSESSPHLKMDLCPPCYYSLDYFLRFGWEVTRPEKSE